MEKRLQELISIAEQFVAQGLHPYSREVKSKLREYGVEVVGTGSTRFVLALDDSRVVKFAFNEERRYYNKQEVEKFMNVLGTESERFYTKILDFDTDFFWIVAERVDNTVGDNDVAPDVYDRYMKIIPNEVKNKISDNCLFNFGIRRSDGSWVCLDYAC